MSINSPPTNIHITDANLTRSYEEIVFASSADEIYPWLGAWLRRIVPILLRNWESAEVTYRYYTIHRRNLSNGIYVFIECQVTYGEPQSAMDMLDFAVLNPPFSNQITKNLSVTLFAISLSPLSA